MQRTGENVCDCLPQCSDDDWLESEISQASFPGRGFLLSRTFNRLAKKLNLKLESELQYFK